MAAAEPPSDAASRRDPIRAAFATASDGDKVELAIDSYDWVNPLTVVEASPLVEWDVPYDHGWLTRELIVEATQVQYALVYSPDGAACYRYENDSKTMQRGDIEHLALVEDDGEDTSDGGQDIMDSVTEADDERALDPDAVRPDGLTEACVHSVADYYETLAEVADDFGVDKVEAETILEAHGCLDDVDSGQGGGR